ncbi:MAG: glycoside hydrolase family 28 protein [Isosphaeraceae bacterium]
MEATRLLALTGVALICGTFAGSKSDAGPPAGQLSAGTSSPANAARPGQLDVRTLGALGDGRSNDTAAIQRAIDTCARQGGGVVVVDRGTFLTGTLVLRSHVELHLTSTAVLKGVGDLAQYKADPQVVYKLLNRSLIYAQGCEQIALTGQGTIDGQGKAFPATDKDSRPVLIRFRDCHDVRLEGFLVKNSPSFGIHPIHCRQLRVEGLRIDSRVQPNSDGIDIDGCQDVFISNCNISSGDDSIALKTIERGQPCRDIVVTNCVLSSACAAIRVGPDAVTNIERVCVSNCVIRDTGMNGVKIQESFGSVMRDMVFSNLVMDNVTGPISIRLAGWKLGAGNVWAVFDDGNWEKGKLRNILFDNIRARVPGGGVKSCISITGTPHTRPRDITFSNMDITFPGGGTAEEAARRDVPDLERDYPEYMIFGVLPAYGLYLHHAQGITLNNVRFHLEAEDLRPAVVGDDVQNLELTGLKADGSPKAESLIRLQNTQAALISGSRVFQPLKTFLRVEGTGSQRIRLKGNDLDLAASALSVADKVPSDAVRVDTDKNVKRGR